MALYIGGVHPARALPFEAGLFHIHADLSGTGASARGMPAASAASASSRRSGQQEAGEAERRERQALDSHYGFTAEGLSAGAPA